MNTTWKITKTEATETRTRLWLRRTDWWEGIIPDGADPEDPDVEVTIQHVPVEHPGATFDFNDDGDMTIDLPPEEAIGLNPGDHFRMALTRAYPVPFTEPADA